MLADLLRERPGPLPSPVKVGPTRRAASPVGQSVVLGDGEQDDRILGCVKGVSDGGYDDQVALAAVPGVVAGEQAHPAGEDVDGGLAQGSRAPTGRFRRSAR